MAEAADVSQNSEIEVALLEMLIDKFGGEREPNTEDCRKVIQEWTQMMREAIAEGGKEFEEVVDQAKVAGKENELQHVKRDIQEINQDLKELTEILKMKEQERNQLLRSIETLTRQIQIASQHQEDLRRLYEQCKESYEANLRDSSMDSDLSQSVGQRTHESNASMKINDQIGLSQGSPGSQTSPESSGFSSAHIQGSSSPKDPSGVNTTYDIGTGLNVTTTLQGSPENYQQISTIESSAPGLETPRMLDAPLNLNQTARLSSKTPFIHKSRFGYTDPTAKEWNMPPGLDFGAQSIKKTLILSSPDRQSPLKVDINVQPRPLVQTQSGEHFVCDISLNMQEAKVQAPVETPQNIHWYKAPPQTEAVDRRHLGMFTPRSVFKRHHRAIRNLFESDYESPDSPWGTGRKFHEVFPYEETPPRPSRYDQDSTMEWEIPQQLNQTFTHDDGPSSNQLNKTFSTKRGTRSPGLNQTFSRARSKTPSPLNKTYTPERRSPQLNRTFSPHRRSPQLNRTFSPYGGSPQLNRTFSPQERSPQLNRTFSPQGRSPQPNRTFSPQGRSPALNRTFSPQGRSPPLNRSFTPPGGASPQLNRAWQSPSPSPREPDWLNQGLDPGMFPPYQSPPERPIRRFGSPDQYWLYQAMEPMRLETYFEPDEGLGGSLDSLHMFDDQEMSPAASPR